MENMQDFVIENGVLEKYKGPGGDVTIPEGVKEIGLWAFKGCANLTSVTNPGGCHGNREQCLRGLREPDQRHHPGGRHENRGDRKSVV